MASNPFSDILAGGVQGLAETAKSIIEEFHLSPEQKAEQLARVEAAQAAALQSARDYDTKMNEIAGQNIRAEAQSGDKFTERARPAVIWVGVLAIVWDYCLLPTIAMIWNKALPSIILPDFVWGVWGTIVTGYVFSRTADKALSLPGSTQISVLGGAIKGSNAPTP